jgi:hypothetical protein
VQQHRLPPEVGVDRFASEYPLAERHLGKHHHIGLDAANVFDKGVPGGILSAHLVGKFANTYLHGDKSLQSADMCSDN